MIMVTLEERHSEGFFFFLWLLWQQVELGDMMSRLLSEILCGIGIKLQDRFMAVFDSQDFCVRTQLDLPDIFIYLDVCKYFTATHSNKSGNRWSVNHSGAQFVWTN